MSFENEGYRTENKPDQIFKKLPKILRFHRRLIKFNEDYIKLSKKAFYLCLNKKIRNICIDCNKIVPVILMGLKSDYIKKVKYKYIWGKCEERDYLFNIVDIGCKKFEKKKKRWKFNKRKKDKLIKTSNNTEIFNRDVYTDYDEIT